MTKKDIIIHNLNEKIFKQHAEIKAMRLVIDSIDKKILMTAICNSFVKVIKKDIDNII